MLSSLFLITMAYTLMSTSATDDLIFIIIFDNTKIQYSDIMESDIWFFIVSESSIQYCEIKFVQEKSRYHVMMNEQEEQAKRKPFMTLHFPAGEDSNNIIEPLFQEHQIIIYFSAFGLIRRQVALLFGCEFTGETCSNLIIYHKERHQVSFSN